MTVLDLFRSSLRLIQELRPGQGPGLSWTTDVLFVANAMLSSWAIDRLMVYAIERDLYTLKPNQLNYKIGPGAVDFSVPRPTAIDSAGIVDLSNAALPVERPIEVLTDQQWEQEPYKAGIFASLPTRVYWDRANPISTLWLLPICSAANQLALYTWVQFSAFVNLTDVVAFPPGYADAIRYNLAVRLAPEWGAELRPDVADLARRSKADIASINAPSPVMQCDPAIARMGKPGYYDAYTNTFR